MIANQLKENAENAAEMYYAVEPIDPNLMLLKMTSAFAFV